jgi:hypothetical protein
VASKQPHQLLAWYVVPEAEESCEEEDAEEDEAHDTYESSSGFDDSKGISLHV